jgi:DNA-binding response OmpR family regulator
LGETNWFRDESQSLSHAMPIKSNHAAGMIDPRAAKLVMLMEDDEDIARLVVHHLQSGGFRTHRPSRPEALISEAETEQPALLILDLMLPELDGFELCRSIRRHQNLGKIPILILTARTGLEERKRAMESGADSYMTKPFVPSELMRAVQGLSDGD